MLVCDPVWPDKCWVSTLSPFKWRSGKWGSLDTFPAQILGIFALSPGMSVRLSRTPVRDGSTSWAALNLTPRPAFPTVHLCWSFDDCWWLRCPQNHGDCSRATFSTGIFCSLSLPSDCPLPSYIILHLTYPLRKPSPPPTTSQNQRCFGFYLLLWLPSLCSVAQVIILQRKILLVCSIFKTNKSETF